MKKLHFCKEDNSAFIKELYLKYLNNPKSIPQSWKEFFDGLDEDEEIIKKEILRAKLGTLKKMNIKIKKTKPHLNEEKNIDVDVLPISKKEYEIEKETSVKAIALIRAYRIRGHLIANLDPLGMMEREYLHELTSS